MKSGHFDEIRAVPELAACRGNGGQGIRLRHALQHLAGFAVAAGFVLAAAGQYDAALLRQARIDQESVR